MRKKEWLAQMSELLERNAALEQRLRESEAETGKARARTEDLERRLMALEAAAPLPVETAPAAPTEAIPETTVLPEGPAEEEETADLPVTSQSEAEEKAEKDSPVITEDGAIDVSALAKLPVSKEMQYASEAIGEIVVSCASACNEFAARGGSAARELINLALGRTEVFKADCLTIATSNTGFSVKKECIDRIKADTESYFDGLKAQHFE